MKKNYTAGIFFCLMMILALPFNLQAQQAASQQAVSQQTAAVVRLTADEAVDLAIRNNLGLESSRTSLETKRRASELSWNQFIPTVDVGGAILRLNEAPAGMTLPIPPPVGPIIIPGGSQWRVTGSLSVSLSFNAAMIEEMKRLRIEYEGGLLTYEKAKAQLERDIRKLYHNMLLMQENLNLLHSSFENVERQVQIAQANYRAGFIPELTLLQAQVARENMRPVIDQVENGLKLLMAQFAFFLGMSYETEFELTPISDDLEFILVDAAEMISQAAAGKPEINELRNTILSLNSLKKATTLRIYSPTISLSWSADPSFSGDPWKDSWFNMDRWNQQQGMFRITLGFRLNGLLPFGVESQGLKSLDDQIKIATIGLAQLVRGTEIEVYNIVLALERTRINTQALEQTVALAQQAYRLTEQAYRAGLQDYFQVQNAEQSLRQAQVQLLEQHFTYLNGLIDLEYAIGVPFGTLSGRR